MDMFPICRLRCRGTEQLLRFRLMTNEWMNEWMDIYLLRTRTTENAKYTAHLVQVWQQCRNCANSWHQFNKPRALNWGSDSNRTTAAPHNHDADILKQQRKTCSVATDVKYCEFNWMPLLSVEFKVSLLLYEKSIIIIIIIIFVYYSCSSHNATTEPTAVTQDSCTDGVKTLRTQNISAPSNWCRNVRTVRHETLRHWYRTASTSSKHFCYHRPYWRTV